MGESGGAFWISPKLFDVGFCTIGNSAGGAPSCDFLTCGRHAVCKPGVLSGMSSKKLSVSERVDLLLCKSCMDLGQTRIKGPSANVSLGLAWWKTRGIFAPLASVVKVFFSRLSTW